MKNKPKDLPRSATYDAAKGVHQDALLSSRNYLIDIGGWGVKRLSCLSGWAAPILGRE